VLSWNRDTFDYVPQEWDFAVDGTEYNDFATADD
jgi:hypothetical protein